jgi:ribonuclease Z
MYFTFLGTSGAVPSHERDTTSLAVVGRGATILVDCGGSPVQKLRRAGLSPLDLTHVIVTHFHPDHSYGLPALIQNLVLMKRREPLALVVRPEHVEVAHALLDVFRLRARPGMFPLTVRAIDLTPGARAFEVGALAVSTAPNHHGDMPNFAVRVDAPSRGAVVYSSDTTPCEAVVDLARGADTLIHEATFPARDRGRFGAHSTALEAGEIAARAGVRRLILTHIDADYHDEVETLAAEARSRFPGVVEIASEMLQYPIPPM